MALRTAARRFSLTLSGFCSTNDTNDGETPASFATSYSVGRRAWALGGAIAATFLFFVNLKE
jgi:hypothetical protein